MSALTCGWSSVRGGERDVRFRAACCGASGWGRDSLVQAALSLGTRQKSWVASLVLDLVPCKLIHNQEFLLVARLSTL